MKSQAEDREIFEKLIRLLDKKEIAAGSSGERMIEIGKFFLGRPYAAGTLETKRAEHLVVDLREHDCVTYVENVVALASLIESGERTFESFRRLLKKVRYRRGSLEGFTSRLHYFSDWIYDNQKKGIVRNVTKEVGGRPSRRVISFMTTHPSLYPPLKNMSNLLRMRSIEKAISQRLLLFVLKRDLRRVEDQIRDGDIIAVTTNRKGLDIQHVGLAARVGSRIHLLSASSKEGKVCLSRKTLYGYLMEDRARSGIMVARLES